MVITTLAVQSFRNLATDTLQFGPGFNVLHGDNAQGKTSLLEAIYLLGTLKSFRMARNHELIRWGMPFAVIRGSVRDDTTSHDLAVLIDDSGKKLRVDRKGVSRLTEFFGRLTAILFAPEELAMVRGAPETRRRYLDRAIFAGDLHYLTTHHEYGRVLKQRNALLKRGSEGELEIWDQQLSQAGARLVGARVTYLQAIGAILGETYRGLTGCADEAAISYRSAGSSYTGRVEADAESIREALARSREQERLHRTTVVGPHRDDLLFTLNGRTLRHGASQGQQRCYVLALKMAEIECLRQSIDGPPVLLLDDITSELDRQRAANLFSFLADRDLQVFVTTTGLDHLPLGGGIRDLCTFHVKQGTVTPENRGLTREL